MSKIAPQKRILSVVSVDSMNKMKISGMWKDKLIYFGSSNQSSNSEGIPVI